MSENGEVIDMGETIYNLRFDFGASSGRMILSKFPTKWKDFTGIPSWACTTN